MGRGTGAELSKGHLSLQPGVHPHLLQVARRIADLTAVPRVENKARGLGAAGLRKPFQPVVLLLVEEELRLSGSREGLDLEKGHRVLERSRAVVPSRLCALRQCRGITDVV